MNLYDLEGTEQHPVYQEMATANVLRHYDFLYSIIRAALASDRQWLSQSLIKALNFHAIVGLHHEAGQYRSHGVRVDQYHPPPHYRIESLMDDFVNYVNRTWERTDVVKLAVYALWRINYIHPFVNGNGRTARAVCYFILCVKSGGLLRGQAILPEVLRREPVRALYIEGLQRADEGDFNPLATLVMQLIGQQIEEG